MKTRCTDTFTETLIAVGLTYEQWRQLARRSHCTKRTRWIRQVTRQVQRVHTGKGMWWHGRWCRRGK